MLLKALEKHAEFTYGVHASVLEEAITDNTFSLMAPEAVNDILKHLDRGIMGARRSLIAAKELLRQAIAYGITYKVVLKDDKPSLLFLVYRRNKTNGEGGLVHVLSLGAGGHVEGDDLSYHVIKGEEEGEVHASASIDLLETLDDSFVREYVEEVMLIGPNDVNMSEALIGNEVTTGFKRLGFVMDSAQYRGYVGNIHFGVVYALEAPAEVERFEMTEPQNDAVCWASVEDIRSKTSELYINDNKFEPWSELLIKQIGAIESTILHQWHGVPRPLPAATTLTDMLP